MHVRKELSGDKHLHKPIDLHKISGDKSKHYSFNIDISKTPIHINLKM